MHAYTYTCMCIYIEYIYTYMHKHAKTHIYIYIYNYIYIFFAIEILFSNCKFLNTRNIKVTVVRNQYFTCSKFNYNILFHILNSFYPYFYNIID